MVKLDIHTLAHHLKQERLYVNSEKQLIQRLNADVLKTAEKLYRTAWIAKQQRINLDRLIITSAEASPAECCQHAKILEDTQFVDGYKQLGFQETAYGEFLSRLRENPRLIASSLVAGEKLNQENTQSVIYTVFTSLYGNCIMQEDESYLLQEKLFGEKGSDRFRQKVQEMVDSNEAKLVALVNKFIGYLKQNTYCFPHSLRWIVSQMYKTLSCVDRLEVGEVRAMCTDLLLACFICPAVVNPEQYGIISDAPINEVARFNLMQVGRLLQQLAMTGSEEGDPRTKSSLGKFDKSCVAAFLDVVIGGRAVETPPLSSVNLLEGLSRTVVYITYSQLITLVNFMKSVMSGDQLREDRMALDNLLANLPQAKPGKSSSLEMTPYNTPQLSPATTPANKKNRLPIATRSRSRTNVLMDLHMDHEGSSQETIQEIQPEEVLVISLGTGPQLTPGMMSENEVLNMQLSDGGQGDVPVDENKLHGKPDKTLRFSLCSDNLEGISEGPSNRSNSVSSLDLEGESVSELGAGPSGSNGVEALQLLEHEQATTQDNLDDKLRKFEIRDMMGLTDDRDISETVSETWSTDVLGSDFDPNIDEDRLQEIAGAAAENMLGSLLCLPGSGSVLLDPCTGSTISETTSEAWSVEVLPSDSEAPDLKQEERLQELESCSGLGSTSDDTDVREVSSRPSTPGLSVVSGISATSEDIPNKIEDLRSECSSDFGGKDSVTSPDMDEVTHGAHQLTSPPSQSESLLAMFDPLSSHEGASAVVRPKVHYARPSHPPPDPPILEGAVGGNEARLPNFGSHVLTPAEMEAFRQRHSYPERLVRSRSSDIVSSVRRPMSDPSWNRRPGNEERELPPAAAIGATSLVAAPHSSSSSPSKDSSRGETEERKDSDDEKSDRNRPWWRKRFVSAMPKAPIPFRKKEKQERDKDDLGPDRFSALTGTIAALPTMSRSAPDIIALFQQRHCHEVMGDGESAHDSPRDETLQNISADDLPDSASQAAHPQDSAFSYRDAKKKLRLALCSADSVAFPVLTHSTRNGLPDHTDPEDNEIVCFLKVQIAEAINLQDKNLMAQLQETMRCVCRFDNRTCRKLLASIAEDYRDAKKKLRLALCSADSVAFPVLTHSTRNGLPDHTDPEDNEIVCFLKVQIAEAINLQDKNLMAQLQETMRCVCRFDNRTCRKLLASIAEDYRKRAPYIAYLTRCRQGLQTTQAHLERLLQRVLRDKEVANRYFTTVCVRLLLESKEKKIREFIQDFQKLTAADDKTAQVEDFLQFLYGAMAQDVIWQNASEEQLQDAQLAIERSVMNRIFKLAFYPNQDGDILRDQVLHEHIQRLSKVVTANHRALQIPEVYLREAPWPSAQSEIRTISAYKTPRDKVQCILRMCSTIMNLLSLANEDSVPGADDFVPVLVFVLIKANPPCLLSTVQYISSFYASCLSGEESYWWMQFTAAVEFIKTIDDRK
ncbi:GTPase-activating protein and VPS9 domain-containing protein 1 [Pteropus alecto]|uniref:GTPase-activating protein and VPS9 domain-containing protein 1 n=1 Tax=Pteropus alecto TaxID=9402 RepID=L5K664_PTEAL|nr:GTPase-activating protein and VPS9 domain-containing protein 1 [Pteropus alecto]